MVQGLIGGATSYEEQSLQDMMNDIDGWIKYAKDTKIFLSEQRECMEKSKYIQKIPYGFIATMYTTITYIDTILYDFNIITEAMKVSTITEKEVNLIKKIGRKANDFNIAYGKTYREDTRYWHDYGNPDFKVVEEFYSKGRDFFVTLQDAASLSFRLDDYVVKGQVTNNNISIGDNNLGVTAMQGNNNVVNNTIMEKSFDYEKTLKVLKEIEGYLDFPQFTETFEGNSENLKKIVLETILATELKNDEKLITKSLQLLKNLTIGATSSIISSGIIALLGTLPL